MVSSGHLLQCAHSLFPGAALHSTAQPPPPPPPPPPPLPPPAAAAVTSVAPSQPFRLLDLPDELWVKIGKFAVTYSDVILINQDLRVKEPTEARKNDDDGNQRCEKECCIIKRDQPAITKTCRLLRTELLPEYYKLNTFHVINRMTTNLMLNRTMFCSGAEIS
ncbi:uncharacterized protein MYCFIDRAFT_75576 [Pseudocercospora fijiensis CIRAD86]|uniref:Uncharacterized protein n=1 Tax=Pseudocercospora fijiensis (strain CIRAD86) TaxID=383855 RepID=N1QA15_PSEFD|nr:uncharacterized protein MYCFIDRAFT_75576 [Pseudocercospora fijiensis CIRAD86]EME87732.1 hypothetical protein MYCFIDRAFT_75576 [Pseudocercospora fijiensis CIRAD86]